MKFKAIARSERLCTQDVSTDVRKRARNTAPEVRTEGLVSFNPFLSLRLTSFTRSPGRGSTREHSMRPSSTASSRNPSWAPWRVTRMACGAVQLPIQ